MIASLGRALSRLASRWVPDPFVLALLLTAVAAAAGAGLLTAGDPPPRGIGWTLAEGWLGGFASAGGLAFALQMCLVLVTGHALALSPPVQRFIDRVSRLPASAAAATGLVATVACLSALVHWGLGAIAGALLAREIGRHSLARGPALHYPLLGAAAYTGLAVWHGGLSGSAPLKVAEGDKAELIGTIPLGDMLLSPLNLAVSGALVVLIPLLCMLLSPKEREDLQPPDPDRLRPLPERTAAAIDSPVTWLQEAPWVGRAAGALILALVLASVALGRGSLDINTVNLLFLGLGLLMQGGLRHYLEAVADGARAAGAIIVQFPLYFGILGIMTASGMVSWLSDALVDLSTAASFPVLAFLSAGLVNFFVPSGGGQWAVQSDILLRAGGELGVEPATTIMAFAYGDAWTNMLQPFWALPLLGIMGLRARDIIGYTAMVFLLVAIVVPTLLLTFA